MAEEQTSGGWIYDSATGTKVDETTALNAQARVLEVKQAATIASTDAAQALQTANSFASQIAQANTTAGEAKGIAQAAEGTAGNAVDRVEELEILGGVAPGDPTDATIALHMQQPGSQTETALNAQSVQAVGGRIVFTDDPTITVPDGTLVVHYQGPRSWTENFSDGLYGMTPRWANRDQWEWAAGDVAIPAAPESSTVSLRGMSIDRLGENDRDVEILAEVSTSRLLDVTTCGLALRGSGDAAGANCFYIGIRNDGFRVMRYMDGVATTLGNIRVGTVLVDVKYMIRFRVEAGVGLQAKAWPSSQAEPAAWDYSEGVSTIQGPGWAGLYSGGKLFNTDQRWHRLAVATQGQTAVFS